MTFDLFMLWSNCVPVAVAILEDCCMAFAKMQVSELWPMGLLFLQGTGIEKSDYRLGINGLTG